MENLLDTKGKRRMINPHIDKLKKLKSTETALLEAREKVNSLFREHAQSLLLNDISQTNQLRTKLKEAQGKQVDLESDLMALYSYDWDSVRDAIKADAKKLKDALPKVEKLKGIMLKFGGALKQIEGVRKEAKTLLSSIPDHHYSEAYLGTFLDGSNWLWDWFSDKANTIDLSARVNHCESRLNSLSNTLKVQADDLLSYIGKDLTPAVVLALPEKETADA